MKYKISVLFSCIAFVFFNSAGFAQTAITIAKSDMPVAGDTLRFSNALPSQSIDLSQTGANYTWNFSKLQFISQHIDTFFSMSALPNSYRAIFSNGAFATHTNVPDSIGPIALTNVYTIYQLNSSEYGGLGDGEEIDGLPVPIVYDSLDVLYSFPLNFDNVDSSHTSYALSIPTLGFMGEKRKRINVCDGWGTLTTPYGTFNVLRVKSTLTLNDSIYIDDLSFGISIPSITYQYKWLAKEGGEPILEIDEQDISGIPVIEDISYRDSDRVPTGINLLLSQGALKVFPNPASTKLYFSNLSDNPAPVTLRIYSIYGSLVYQQTAFIETNSGIDLTNLPCGAYIAELLQGDKLTHQKFIIAH